MDARHPLAVVTPTIDGDLLAVMAQADVSFTTGQLHRMLPDFSEDGIRRVLARLAKQGIVLSERAGNAYLYRFNRDHLAAGPIIALAAIKITLLQRIEESLSAWAHPPVYACLFGSMARGSAQYGSDVDLLLVRPDDVEEQQWDTQVAELTADVTRWTGNDTRPIEFTADEIRARRNDPLFKGILADGLTVHGHPEWLQRQLRLVPARSTRG